MNYSISTVFSRDALQTIQHETEDLRAGRARFDFRVTCDISVIEAIGRPESSPGTRFHFKTEVLRFGRAGRTYTHSPGRKLPDSKCSTKRHFIACEEKSGQLHASPLCVLCSAMTRKLYAESSTGWRGFREGKRRIHEGVLRRLTVRWPLTRRRVAVTINLQLSASRRTDTPQ